MNPSAALPVVSKSQYAVLKNVSPGRVSQWISEGKIEPDALVGEGRSARINVHLADAYLRRKLDIGQRFGNGLSTRLTEPAKPPVATAVDLEVEPSGPIEEQIKREKLEGLQRENRKRAEEEAARAGRYVDAQASASEMAKMVARTVAIYDMALPEIADAMSGKFNISQRDVLHFLRAEFRTMRGRAAADLRDAAAEVEPTIDVETADEEAKA
jgi:hypothetical protein